MPAKPPHFIRARQREGGSVVLIRAAIHVYNRVDEPGSDAWHQVEQFREDLYKLIRDEWFEITGRNPLKSIFPYNRDYVIHRVYTGYRKTAIKVDNDVTDYLGEPRNVKKELNAGRRERATYE